MFMRVHTVAEPGKGCSHHLRVDFDQGSLTSLLLRLSRPTKPVACFTAGHGERDINDDTEVGLSHLAAVVRYLFDVKALSLAAPGGSAELQKCAVVIAAGPRIPMLPQELSVLAAYTRNNGRLLIFGDSAQLRLMSGAPRGVAVEVDMPAQT